MDMLVEKIFCAPLQNFRILWQNQLSLDKHCLLYSWQWFIKHFTRLNEDDKKDQICYIMYYKYVLCTCKLMSQNMS